MGEDRRDGRKKVARNGLVEREIVIAGTSASTDLQAMSYMFCTCSLI